MNNFNASAKNDNKALNPTVLKLGFISFFCDVASEMLYPITPIFLTTVLGASMASLGIVEGFAEGLASLLKTYSGSWSDSLKKRKPFIFYGYLFGALSKPFIGLSSNWYQVFGARLLDRTGKGIRTAPRDALLSESVELSNRGAAFGWHRGMDSLGAAVGPLLAIALLSFNAENLRSLYFWALIPGLISVLLVLTLKESRHEGPKKIWENPLKTWNRQSQEFRRYMFAWAIFSVANSSDVFLLMRAKDVGFSTTKLIFLYCAYNLLYSLSSPFLGQLSDRCGRKSVLAGGLLVFFAVYLGFGFASDQWHFWVLFLIYGIYMGATDGVGKALAVDLSQPGYKATSVGILGTVTGLGAVVASIFAGQVWDRLGSSFAFWFGAAGALVAAILLSTLKTSPLKSE